MVTFGRHPDPGPIRQIARETCRQLAMGDKVYDSQRLLGGGMSGSEIRDFIEAADGFGEVLPEDKYSVVDLLRQRGHLVAMTGDGVNDAPALKKADCGIAVEGASDAAQSAADIVFLDEGLSTMILAIKTAREIFHRMKAYIIYRIALCLHLEIYLVLSMLILKYVKAAFLHSRELFADSDLCSETIRVDLVVFLGLFADVATIAIAYDNAQSAHRPVEWQLPKVWIISTILGILLAAGTWIIRGTLFIGPPGHGGIIQNFGSIQETLFLQVRRSFRSGRICLTGLPLIRCGGVIDIDALFFLRSLSVNRGSFSSRVATSERTPAPSVSRRSGLLLPFSVSTSSRLVSQLDPVYSPTCLF